MQAPAEHGLAGRTVPGAAPEGQHQPLLGSVQAATSAGDARGGAGVQKKVDLSTLSVGTGNAGAGSGRSGVGALAAAEAAAAAVLAAGFGGASALEEHDWEDEERLMGTAGPTGQERLREAALSGLALGGRQELIVCASLVRAGFGSLGSGRLIPPADCGDLLRAHTTASKPVRPACSLGARFVACSCTSRALCPTRSARSTRCRTLPASPAPVRCFVPLPWRCVSSSSGHQSRRLKRH